MSAVTEAMISAAIPWLVGLQQMRPDDKRSAVGGAIRAALDAQPATALGRVADESRIMAAAVALLSACDARHDTKGAPMKYGVPYVELNALRAAMLGVESLLSLTAPAFVDGSPEHPHGRGLRRAVDQAEVHARMQSPDGGRALRAECCGGWGCEKCGFDGRSRPAAEQP